MSLPGRGCPRGRAAEEGGGAGLRDARMAAREGGGKGGVKGGAKGGVAMTANKIATFVGSVPAVPVGDYWRGCAREQMRST